MILIRLFQSPFDVQSASLPANMRIEHIRLLSNMDLRSSFQPLHDVRLSFWRRVFSDSSFPLIKNAIIRTMTQFGTTYRCESRFSFVKRVKDRFRSRMRDEILEAYVHLHVSTYTVSIDECVGSMQLHAKRPKHNL